MSNRPAAPTGRRRPTKIDGSNSNSNNASSNSGNLPRSLDHGGVANSKSNGYGSGHAAPPSYSTNTNNASDDDDDDPSAVTARSSLLQPRLAVVLGLSRKWHPLLFLCRLLSIAPALWCGFPSMVRLLALVHLRYFARAGGGGGGAGGGGSIAAAASALPGAFVAAAYDWSSYEAKLRFKEAWLAVLWCCASGYISFFLTDSLMSRALLNYTPLATLFRLSVINLANGFFTSTILRLFGAPTDPRFSLAAWIAIASLLTVVYGITQRGINIRKETSMSMSMFSFASFVTMVVLFWHLHVDRAAEYPDIPLVQTIKLARQMAEELAVKIMEYGNVTGDL
ncbi:N-glycosylation protein-domain-containing protein [Apodospora peruviana]|uniref:N-glycosylation protein-domain-containing protein n=1 Tax=Apodospora peruviana TaxID=516989 RepID=A0AAE0ITN7_9PEZI|nr:N-glycosylation protein-domain-containing protein [Apodospora peruviana]